jgi:hypothetical protein
MKKYKKVKTLLADPKRWCKGYYAVDSNGKISTPLNPEAVCWCLSGAVKKIYTSLDSLNAIHRKLRDSVEKLYPLRFAGNIIAFNDAQETTYKDIMKVLKDANV